MDRLRVRIELSRGARGVPMQKLASIAEEAHKFLRMLGNDVGIDGHGGEWLALDFDEQSLNFTAEYMGPAGSDQVRNFYGAFDGATLMQRSTIAQFTRIVDAVGDDEVVGFGLYQNDEDIEPAEWRSLSKRDALRMSDEMRLLLERRGGGEPESLLPATLDPGAAFFKRDRDLPGSETRGMTRQMQTVEARLVQRISRVEGQVSSHSLEIQGLRSKMGGTEQSMTRLLESVEDFCDRASRQFAKIDGAFPPAENAPRSLPEAPSRPAETVRRLAGFLSGLRIAWLEVALVAGLIVTVVTMVYLLRTPALQPKPPAFSVMPAGTVSVQAASPVRIAADRHGAREFRAESRIAPVAKLNLEVQASEKTWLALWVDGKKTGAKIMESGAIERIGADRNVQLYIGNAGGLRFVLNGAAIGPVGTQAQVRRVEFTSKGLKILPLNSGN